MSAPNADARVVVIGTSAGGVETLCRLCAELPGDLDAPVLVVLHLAPYASSALPQILDRCGPLPAQHAEHGEALRAGRIYIAPPDHHLTVEGDRIAVDRGPKENGMRPAIDTLFRSAAQARGSDVIAVVLSGTLDDGTEGLRLVKRAGGVTIVQDPADALFSAMPASAVRYGEPDHVLPLAGIGALIGQLAVAERSRDHGGDAVATVDDQDATEDEPSVVGSPDAASAADQAGEITELTCPSCGGTLWETSATFPRYHCRVGHAFTADALVAEQTAALEAAMWSAVVALEERADLAQRMARRAVRRGQSALADRFTRQRDEARQRAEMVRAAIPDERDSLSEGEAGE